MVQSEKYSVQVCLRYDGKPPHPSEMYSCVACCFERASTAALSGHKTSESEGDENPHLHWIAKLGVRMLLVLETDGKVAWEENQKGRLA